MYDSRCVSDIAGIIRCIYVYICLYMSFRLCLSYLIRCQWWLSVFSPSIRRELRPVLNGSLPARRGWYPLVNIQETIENHHFEWENPLSMAIFNSYVKLPEGIKDWPCSPVEITVRTTTTGKWLTYPYAPWCWHIYIPTFGWFCSGKC